MIAASKIPPLILIAVLGHSLALFWVVAARFHFKFCQNAIYAIPISKEQIKRELKNSIHAPIHAVILYIFVWLKFFTNDTLASFVISLLLATIWVETWH